MAMGVVDIENIKFFLSKIAGEVEDVTEVGPEESRMKKLYRMVEMKSIRDLHSSLGNPFLNAILDRERGLPIGKGNVMTPFFQSLTEVPCRISRACPFPIAEKM
jgi:hypothetical protein